MNVREGIARELHKQARVNFPRRYVELKGVNDLYQADLVEMIPFSKQNKGNKYIMTIINCFTKYAFAIPLKSKKSEEIVKHLEPILKNNQMKHFQTDEGGEWFNFRVKSLLAKYNINHYLTYSEKKASIVERFNKTLKNKMWTVFSSQGHYHWLKILPGLIKKYNSTVHRTIGKKPIDVDKSNENEVLQHIIKHRKPFKITPKFDVGDRVRISRIQKIFTKGYLPRWSNEIFTVWRVNPTSPVTYTLKDDKGEMLKGCFYQQELSKTQFSDTYLIEKVVKRKANKVLVRWLGFDKSHDSWVDKKELIK